MRWSPAAMALTTVLVVTACSGDDDTATTTAAPTTTTAVAAATVAPSSTSPTPTPPVTDPPATTTEPPAALTTAPSTTEEPRDERFAVLDAVEAGMVAVIDLMRDPVNDAELARLDDYFTGTLLEGWRNVAINYREMNYREIENPEQPDDFEIELASLAINQEGTFASVQGCEITAGIIVETGGNADGSDRVVQDGISKKVIELEVVNEDGTWKISEVVTPEEADRIASCD